MNNEQTAMQLLKITLVAVMTTLVVFASLYAWQYFRPMLLLATVSWNG